MQTVPYRSPLVRAYNAPRSLLSRRQPPLTLDEVLVGAQQLAGTADCGDEAFIGPLSVLLTALADTSNLHAFGRLHVKNTLTHILGSRLALCRYWAHHPEVLQPRIERPIVILGMPRSGTSFLFNLLARDPAHRYLSNWEATVSQVPPPRLQSPKRDPRRLRGMAFIQIQRHLVPHMEAIHQFHLDGPEECTPILMQSFASTALSDLFGVPDYDRWVRSAPLADTYGHHDRVLRTLQSTYPGTRWLLKAPEHMRALNALLATYPDACVVQTHRDPVDCVPSYASLCAAFRGVHANHIDRHALGAEVLERLGACTDSCMDQRRHLDGSRIFDVRYDDLVADPSSVVRNIYEHFDLPLTGTADRRMQHMLESERDRVTKHRYALADFGLTVSAVRERFGRYSDAFGLLERAS